MIVEERKENAKKDVVLKKRSAFEMRMRYLSSLTYKGVWLAPMKQKKSHQNVIVLDYDDTMLPTSFFLDNDNGDYTDLGKMASTHMKMLVQVQNNLLALLEKMISFAKVLIVTNAKTGWVEYSSYFLLPRVHKMIDTYIPVISAQSEYGCDYPRDPSKWKELAFQHLWDVEGLLERDCLLNLMVVGDSEYEIDAGKAMKRNSVEKTNKRIILKSVKFTDDPSPSQLIK